MSLEKRYFNISTLKWVRAAGEPGDAGAPTFGHKDLRDFSVQFLQQLSSGVAEIIPDIVAAQIGLAVGATKVTSATASAPSNNHFPFVLPVIDASGSALADLMTGKTSPQALKAEFKLTTASGTNRYYTSVFVAPQINVDAVPDPAVVEPAVTMSEVTGVCALKERPVDGYDIWTDRITGEKVMVYVEGRQFRFDILG